MADRQPRQDFDPGPLPENDRGTELIIEAFKRWEAADRGPIQIQLLPRDAWAAMIALQMGARGRPLALWMEDLQQAIGRVGRALQDNVCDSAELYELAERNWAWARDVGRADQPAGFTCPLCGMTSHNPKDAREGYCGNCHRWTGLHGSITPEIARHVLYEFNASGGYAAGDFTRQLIGMLQRADVDNRGRLARVFPGYAQAVALIDSSLDGVEVLQQIAAGGEQR